MPTFQAFGKQWTSGDLHRKWPDHVRDKRTSDQDADLLRLHVNVILGPTPIDQVTLEDADRVMAALPSDSGATAVGKRKCRPLSPATRRHVAQVINRVMSLAVYPARLIQTSSIPKGWNPKPGPRKGKSCLYPAEDAQLLACKHVPLVERMVFGVLAREGMRPGELLTLR